METDAPKKTADNEAQKMTQTEVDAVFTSIRDELSKSAKKTVRPYVFQKPDYLSSDKLRRLRAKHDDVVHEMNAAISLLLRREFFLRVSRLETTTYGKLLESLPNQTHVTLFHMPPLAGSGFLEMTPQLGLTVVGRMLGSQGHLVKNEREMTEIDYRMLDRFVEVILREYIKMWLPYEHQLQFEIDGHENNPRFMKLAQPDTIMVFLVMEARMGSASGYLRMGLPYVTLETLINKLVALPHSTTQRQEVSAISGNIAKQPIMDVPVEILANWPGLKLTFADLQKMRKDDIFILGNEIPSSTAIYVSGVQKFIGQVGRKGDQLAVRITSKIN